MSKRRKHKRKGRGGRHTSPYSHLNISRIRDHTRRGTKLSPPLTQIPATNLSSWVDDHMPEMLWAVLLTRTFERKQYLACFRQIAIQCKDWFPQSGAGEPEANQIAGTRHDVGHTVVIDQTKLSEVTDQQFQEFIVVILRYPLAYAALRPILRIESLPGAERWRRALSIDTADNDWTVLAEAIAGVLDHQSEPSTDIRWFKLILTAISGHLFFPLTMSDRIEELRLFPDRGDMRSVRPFIRSSEMMLRRNPPSPWIRVFWAELLRKTRCIDPTPEGDYSFTETTIDLGVLFAVRHDVIQGFLKHMSAERTDARLDSAFGLVLYALSIVEEIALHRAQTLILSRLALRALVEANITLHYLVAKNSDKLWRSYRVYGAGQAKLAFLKAQEMHKELPPFIDEDALHAIANEDMWQEYLDIDVGHWANSNLRKIAMESGAKDLYDKYYDWASAFAHSHWGAVRDTNFLTCHNPLHRLHRIPRRAPRLLNSVEIDAVELANEMVAELDRLYPGDTSLGRLAVVRSEPT